MRQRMAAPGQRLYPAALLALMTATTLILSACDKKLSAEDYIHRAEQARQANDISASVINLKNALQLKPENAKARLMLGQDDLALGDGAGAEIEIGRAGRHGADAEAVRLGLAEAWLLQGKYEQVLKKLPEGSPANPHRLILRGRAYLGLDQKAEAQAAFTKAAAAEPNAAAPEVWLGRLALGRGELDEARQHLKKALQRAPNDIDVLALQGDVTFAEHQYSASEKAFHAAFKQRRTGRIAYAMQLGVARAEINLGKLKEATKLLEALLKAAPNNPGANYLRAVAAYQAKDFQTALNHANLVLKVASDYRPAILLAGAAAYALGQNEQALSQLQRFVAEVPNNLDARKLLAAAQLRAGKPREAAASLQSTIGKAGNDAQLLGLIGTATARAGDLKTAKTYFARAVARDPNDAAARARLGAAQVALGKRREGLAEIEKAIEQDPKLQNLEIGVALTYLRAREYDKALESAKRIQEKLPDKPIGFILEGISEAAKGEFNKAKAAFQKALEIKPGTPDASGDLAALEARQGNFEEAEQVLKGALAKNPGNLPILLRLTELADRQHKRAQGKVWLDQAMAAHPNVPALHVDLARWYLASGQPDQALEAIRPIEGKYGRAPAVLEVTGQAQMAQRHFSAAVKTYQSLVTASPKSPQALLLLARAYGAAGNAPKMKEQVKAALKLKPDYLPAKLVLARSYLASGQPGQALKAIRPIEGKYARAPAVLEVTGQAQIAQRHFSAAVKTYQSLVTALPKSPQALLLLADAYAAAGNALKMKEQIEAALKLKPDYLPAKLALARYSIMNRDFNSARTQIGEMVKETPDDPRVKELEARLALSEGKPKRAAELMREVRRSFDNPDMAMTEALAEWQSGQREASVNTLEDWIARHPKDTGVRLDLNRYYLALGRRDAAKANLNKIIDVQPENYIALNDLAWLLYQDGNLEPAQMRAEKALKIAPKVAAVKDTLGVILLARQQTRRAAVLLRQAAKEAPNNPEIAYHLAQVLSQSDQPDEARALLQKTLASHDQFGERDKAEQLLKSLGK